MIENSSLERRPQTGRGISIAMLIAGLATFAIFYCVQPLLPIFTKQYGVSAQEASLAVSITIGPMGVGILFAGLLSDRAGRRPLMIASLLAGAILTLLCAVAPNWQTLLLLRLLTGLALAGIPGVAMTYIAEEMEPAVVGRTMGLYVSGTALGGMLGRLVGSLIAEPAGWRAAVAVIGASGLAAALLLWRLTPRSRNFAPRPLSVRAYLSGVQRLLGGRVAPWLLAEAFLLMGAFMAIYNFASYRLLAPPYALSQSFVGAIFLLYLAGSFSSTAAGIAAGRIGAGKTLAIMLLMFLTGIGLTVFSPLAVVIFGIAVVTIGFFGAHSVCSAWISRLAGNDRAQASASYMFCYYLGGSMLGPLGGFAWTYGAWTGVATFAGAMVGLGIIGAIRLSRSDG